MQAGGWRQATWETRQADLAFFLFTAGMPHLLFKNTKWSWKQGSGVNTGTTP